MNEPLALLLAWLAGGMLGAFFFGGLWWTVRKGLSSPCPARWFLGSMLVRMSVALAGFYFVSAGQWQRLAACLVGFVMARLVVMWLTRSSGEKQTQSPPGASHAP